MNKKRRPNSPFNESYKHTRRKAPKLNPGFDPTARDRKRGLKT